MPNSAIILVGTRLSTLLYFSWNDHDNMYHLLGTFLCIKYGEKLFMRSCLIILEVVWVVC